MSTNRQSPSRKAFWAALRRLRQKQWQAGRNYERASRAVERAIRLPHSPEWLARRAKACHLSTRCLAALEAYERAVWILREEMAAADEAEYQRVKGRIAKVMA